MTFETDDTTEAHERRISRCREPTCRAQIVWLENPSTGRNVPVDAETVKADDEHFDTNKGHVSHFKTCKTPARFSKGKR